MKLERFKERDNKRIGIIIFTVSCILLIVGVFFFRSFALFEEKKNFNVINGTITDPGDLYFAYYIDDVITFDFPSKSSGYTLSSKSNCNNGVTVSFDYDNWSALVNYENYQKGNSSKTKCNLYFVPTASKYIETLATTSEEIVDDETSDHNLKYIGSNPNNYVSFNNELWRIIGVMNNIDDGSGKKETRIKLIRNESIGEYSWDTSASTVNSGLGVNEWNQADLMKLLNPGYESESVGGSLYWNRQNGDCYNESSNAITTCDFISTGLTNESKNLINEVVWNLGSNGTYTYNSIVPSKFYELEQSNNTGKICTSGDYCNDKVTRTTKWIGYIGLMHPSDYGFATSGGSTINRITCLNSALHSWKNLNTSDCMDNDWLYKPNIDQWTLTSRASSNSANFIYPVFSLEKGYSDRASYHNAILPVLYLKPNVKILNDGNDGSIEKPFHLSL